MKRCILLPVLVLTLSACGVAAASRPDDTLAPLIPAEGFVAPTVPASVVAVDLPPDAQVQVVEHALAAPGYETFRAAWAASDVWATIAGRPVTVLAPDERTFQHLPHDLLRNMLADPAQIDALLARHVVVGEFRYDQLAKLGSVTNLLGESLPVRVGWDGVVYIAEARVEMPLSADAAVFGYDQVLFDLG